MLLLRSACEADVHVGDDLTPYLSLGADHALKLVEVIHDGDVCSAELGELELGIHVVVVGGEEVARGEVHARDGADILVERGLLHAAEVGLVGAEQPAVGGDPEVAEDEGALLDAVEASDGGRVLEVVEVEESGGGVEEVGEGLELADESVDAGDGLRGARLAVGEERGLSDVVVVVLEGRFADGHDEDGLPLGGFSVGGVEELRGEGGLKGPEEAVALDDRAEAVEGEDDGVWGVGERQRPLLELGAEGLGVLEDGVELRGGVEVDAGEAVAESAVGDGGRVCEALRES